MRARLTQPKSHKITFRWGRKERVDEHGVKSDVSYNKDSFANLDSEKVSCFSNILKMKTTRLQLSLKGFVSPSLT